ncbi:MAG: winged helix DNA-binding domain-containing protein [Bacteroidales bacterium]|nr:winged helix DNA-binding domain-containing protein [Bacteroidales bacterium]
MTLIDISNIRLINQQIITTKFTTVKDIVGWMGAMQAQDYAMVKWAIGARLSNSTNEVIEKAIDQGEIIRTHLLRPTWHFVSAEDIYWLLELTAPKIKASLRLRHQGLELTESLINKSNELIQKALLGGNHLTREEIVAILQNAKIATDENRTSHILMRAELDGIVCSGAIKDKKQTYALLSERVPKTKSQTREESLEKIASRYFTSRCPATLQDFVWWSGLSVSDARNALEMVKAGFISEKKGSETYWFTNSFSVPQSDNNSTYLLPAFDEFLISYKDRSASLPLANFKKAVSDNGIFRPIIVINGQVLGLWKRTIKNDKVIVETDFFQPQNKSIKNLVEEKAIAFGNFLGKKTDVKHSIE